MTDTKTPSPAAVWINVDEIKPWPDNPRNNDAAIVQVAKSIDRFGFGAPIVARKEDGQIIAGHTRLKAAKHLGLTEVPVRFLDLSKSESELLAVADNKLVEIASWDDAYLSQMIQAAPDESWEDFGFSDTEIKKLIGDIDSEIDEQSFIDNMEFRVIVTLESESDQAELVQKLEKEGYQCQMLIS